MTLLKLSLSGLICVLMLGCASLGMSRTGHTKSSVNEKKKERQKRRAVAVHDHHAPRTIKIGHSHIDADQFARDNAKVLAEKRSTLTPQAYVKFVQRRAAQWLNDAISESLIHEHAADKLPEKANEQIDGYVDAEIRKIVTLSYGGSQRIYERQLAAEGKTLEHVRKKIRRQIVISSFVSKNLESNTAEPTRAELWQLYQATKHEYQRPPRRRMSLIDIRYLNYFPQGVDSPTRDQYNAAKAKAYEVMQRITAELAEGATFTDIAKAKSHGLHAVDGGSWGWVTPGSVRERYEPAVKALYSINQDTVSPIIEVVDGYLLVRCDEIDPGYTPSFADVQVELTEQIRRDSYNRALIELVNELREKANLDPQALDSFHRHIVEQEMKRMADAEAQNDSD